MNRFDGGQSFTEYRKTGINFLCLVISMNQAKFSEQQNIDLELSVVHGDRSVFLFFFIKSVGF